MPSSLREVSHKFRKARVAISMARWMKSRYAFPKKAIDLENQKTGWWHAYGACPGEEQPMNISRMQVTHINNPLGFDLGERPTFSWVVEGAAGARAEGLGQNRKMTEEEL